MTFHDPHDPNRPLEPSQNDRSRPSNDRFAGWGLPVLIAAVVFIGGLLLFGMPNKPTTTASNERGNVTTSAPAQPPVPTPPAKSQ